MVELFEDISGSSSGSLTGSFTCAKASPCERLSLHHVNITPASGAAGHFACTRAHGAADDVNPPSCLEAYSVDA